MQFGACSCSLGTTEQPQCYVSPASSQGLCSLPLTSGMQTWCRPTRKAYLGGREQFGKDKPHQHYCVRLVELSAHSLVCHTLRRWELRLNSKSSLIHPLSCTGQHKFQLPTNRISRTQLGNLHVRISQAVTLFLLRRFRSKLKKKKKLKQYGEPEGIVTKELGDYFQRFRANEMQQESCKTADGHNTDTRLAAVLIGGVLFCPRAAGHAALIHCKLPRALQCAPPPCSPQLWSRGQQNTGENSFWPRGRCMGNNLNELSVSSGSGHRSWGS